MFIFTKIRDYIFRLLKPSIYIAGLDYVLKIWRESNAKDRAVLLLVFAPMFFSLGGLIVSLIYFILFVLPSFLFRLIGWGFLTAIFGAAGQYCYKYFTGRNININENLDYIDVEYKDEKESKRS